MTAKVTLKDVNKLCYTEFVAHFGNAVEGTPLIAGAAWSRRPFRSVGHLQQSFFKQLGNLPKEYKRGLLRCLPELGGEMAREHRLSQESMEEQSSTGLLTLASNDDKLRNIRKLSSAYRQKFNFQFFICARENKVDAILDSLVRRLRNEEGEEVEVAIAELMKMTGYRILNLVEMNIGDQSSKL